MGFRNIRLRFDAAAIGLDRAWRIAQVFADQSKREPSAAIARMKLYGLFKLSAGQSRFARLSQARAKRRSRFDEIGRRLKRSPESDDGLLRAVERLESGAQSRIVRRIGRRFGRARKDEQGRLRLAGFAERLADLTPTIDKVRKRMRRSSKTDCAFFSSLELDEVKKAVSGRSGAKRAARSNHNLACARSPAARATRSDDQHR